MGQNQVGSIAGKKNSVYASSWDWCAPIRARGGWHTNKNDMVGRSFWEPVVTEQQSSKIIT